MKTAPDINCFRVTPGAGPGPLGECELNLVLPGEPQPRDNRLFVEWRGLLVPLLALVGIRPDLRDLLPLASVCELNCEATFYRRTPPDHGGAAAEYYRGLGEILEEGRVLRSAAQVIAWDGSRVYTGGETKTVVRLTWRPDRRLRLDPRFHHDADFPVLQPAAQAGAR